MGPPKSVSYVYKIFGLLCSIFAFLLQYFTHTHKHTYIHTYILYYIYVILFFIPFLVFFISASVVTQCTQYKETRTIYAEERGSSDKHILRHKKKSFKTYTQRVTLNEAVFTPKIYCLKKIIIPS